MDPSATKSCPVCGEEIKAIARKCRYCGEYLDGAPMQERRGSRAASYAETIAEEKAVTAFIFGILGVVLCAPIFGPLALVKGNEVKRAARAACVPVPGLGTAGLVLGWVGSGLAILQILYVVLAFVIGISGAAMK
ncbi:MAG: hypothetical protein HY720_12165 [Planctomycetes bacterium]|nr:hypothetical protein [Planctomycetota bacterium]